ncbi:MAG: hypothetical protein HYT76_03210 [Deltaproteobacteria bacterium]|nr:hypothetical protein [Deltaproteobacteria bacterium]
MPLEARLKATLPLLQSTPHRDQAVLEFGRATADFEEFRLRFVVPRDQRPQVQWARDPRTLITNCFDHIRNNSRRAIDAFERSGVYDEAAGTFRFDDASRLEQAMRIYFGAEAATNIGHPTSGPSKGGLLPVILISAGLLGVACAGMWWLMRD